MASKTTQKSYKLKYNEILSLSDAINLFLGGKWLERSDSPQKIIFPLQFKLGAILGEIDKKVESFNKEREKLQKEYAEKDEEGNIVFEEPDTENKTDPEGGDDKKQNQLENQQKTIKMSDENKKAIQKDINDLLDQEVVFNMPVEISVEDFVDQNGQPLTDVPPNYTYNLSKIMV